MGLYGDVGFGRFPGSDELDRYLRAGMDYLQVSEIVRMLAVFDFRHLCVQFAERIRLSCQTLGFGRQNCRAILRFSQCL